MSKITKYSLGLDVSKDTIQACISSINLEQRVKVHSSRKFVNQSAGFKELENWMNKFRKEDAGLIIVMEATGVYYEKAAMFFSSHNYPTTVLVPNKAKKYLQALGLKSKNDKIDAAGLARMGAEQLLTIWQPMGGIFYQLRQLTRHHQQLQESKTQFKNQLHALSHSAFVSKEVSSGLKKIIGLLEKQILETVKSITELTSSDKEIKQKIDNICKIKGVGLMTVATIIAETNGFVLFTSTSQVVSYAGYDVVENQSGNHVGKTKISKKGNTHIRRILHFPAFSAVSSNEKPFVDLYNRVLEKNKIKMKAYVAVQKKLLVYIYTLWKKNEPFARKLGTSSNDEPKPLFLHTKQNKVASMNEATQDELPYNESPEALFLQEQK